MRIGLIGYGAIAKEIIAGAQARQPGFAVCGVLQLPPGRETDGPPVFEDFEAFTATKPDLVVECAGHSAVEAYGDAVLDAGLDLLLVSIGSLADLRLETALRDKARASGRRVLLPAGAIAGIDGLSAASEGGLETVTLTTSKPPGAWAGAPGTQGKDLSNLQEATPVFEGTAREAALAFPKNANVAATVALAGLGFDQTAVRLMADPALTTNRHAIEASGRFGALSVRVDNHPSKDNPKTSALTAMSVLRLIRGQAPGLTL